MQQAGELGSAGQQATAAYISYATFVTFLDWLKDMPAIPTQIDRSLWESKFAGSTGAQLMGGLRFLKLLEGDRPQVELQELVNADKASRKPLMVNLLRRTYGDDLVMRLPTMTPGGVSNKLTALGTSPTTHKKAISFFVNAARDNDLTVPPAIGIQARNRQAKKSAPRQKGGQGGGGDDGGGNGGAGETGHNDPKPPLNFNLHMAVVAMLQDLEQLAPKWSGPERDKWLTTFQFTLDYAYPISEEADDLGNCN